MDRNEDDGRLTYSSADRSSGYLLHGLLIVCVLASATPTLGQGVRLTEVKGAIQVNRLGDVNAEIKERGVSFVLTDGVKRQLEDLVKEKHLDDYKEYERLLALIESREPKELVVAIAGFQNGNENDVKELRIAIEAELKTLGAPADLLRLEPMAVAATPISKEEASQLGNEWGVHLVVWGDWRTESNGQTLFHPRISVIHESKKTPIKKGTSEERSYKLDLAHSTGMNIVESGAVKTSNLITTLIALSYYKASDYDRAAQIFKSLREADVEVYFYLGNCNYYSGRDQEAESYFQKAIAANRTSLEAWHNLGTVRARAGKHTQAIGDFKEALKINPNSDKTLNNLGMTYVEMEEIDQGIAILTRATSVNPKNDSAWYNYGAALLRKGIRETAKAIDVFGQYLKLRSDDHKTWFLCAELSLKTLVSTDEANRPAHIQRGKALLQKAIEVDPGNEKYLRAFVDSRSWTVSREDLNTYNRFLASLPKAGPSDQARNKLRNDLLATTTQILMGLGEFEKAKATFDQLNIDPSSLRNCGDRLLYKLASGRLMAFTHSPFAKTFYTTTYEYFFGNYSEGAVGAASKQWFDTYVQLLKQRPSDLGCLIAKGILQARVLWFSSRAWVNYGFMRKGEDEDEWKGNFMEDAFQTLTRARTLTRDPELKKDLTQCLNQLSEL